MPIFSRTNAVISDSFDASLVCLERNFVKIFRVVEKFGLLQLLAFHWNLPFIYRLGLDFKLSGLGFNQL